MMMLKDHLVAIRDKLKAGHFTHQAAISQGIVLRLLQALSWPTYEVEIVWPEYPINGRKVDFALCHPPGKPKILLEIKTPEQTGLGERQLFEYAFHKGVPMAVLTNGQEWHFFLPAEPGDYQERRVFKLDIVEREIEEIIKRLERYLDYQSVCSGAALEAARADYKDVARDRLIKETLPQAWKKLIEEEDDILLELIADKVENLCGYKPNPDIVADFLKVNVLTSVITAPPITIEKKPLQLKPPQEIGFRLYGQWIPARNAFDVLKKVFLALSEKDPQFLERFAGLPKHGSKRRYLARSPNELFPHRPDLAEKYAVELPGGWFLGANLSKHSIARIIRMACEVAKVKCGANLLLNLGD